MRKIAWLLCLALLAGLALAPAACAEETALPQLEPVVFPDGAVYSVPDNCRENNLPNPDGFGADNRSYHDDSLDIRIYETRAYDTNVYIAFVQIADARQLRTELAREYPSEATLRVSVLSKRVRSVLALNGDWFVYHSSGIIYREGVQLRDRVNDKFDGLAIDANGDFHIVAPITEEGFAAIEEPIINSFAFGPALVIDGVAVESFWREETFKERIAIGQVGPLQYVVAVTDGPDDIDSAGLSFGQMAMLMRDLGAINAYNLDGGSSSCLIFNDQKLNGGVKERMRAVGDIIYFTTAIPN